MFSAFFCKWTYLNPYLPNFQILNTKESLSIREHRSDFDEIWQGVVLRNPKKDNGYSFRKIKKLFDAGVPAGATNKL